MSLTDFQSALARMVFDPAFAAAVRRDDDAALSGYELGECDRRRLTRAAAQRGISITAMLYRGARMSPILRFCPETCAALGSEVLEDVLLEYWKCGPPATPYFRAEIKGFCAYVAECSRVARYTREIAKWEAARIPLATGGIAD